MGSKSTLYMKISVKWVRGGWRVLGLSGLEKNIVEAVLSYRTPTNPYPRLSVSTVAELVGVRAGSVARVKATLVKRGFLVSVPYIHEGGGAGASGWDFGPLEARLKKVRLDKKVSGKPCEAT